MSHVKTDYTYPQPTRHGLSLCRPWKVREDDDDYTTDSDGDNNPRDTLLSLTDHITERLASAEALAWILQSAEQPPEHAIKVTAMLILDLIQEAREANENVWKTINQKTAPEK